MIILHPSDQPMPPASAQEADPRHAPISIAIASTDGLMVDAAFEEAESFRIYVTDRTGSTPELIEQRHALPEDANADESARARWNAELLADIHLVVAADFGVPTVELLEAGGLWLLDGERSVQQALEAAMEALGLAAADSDVRLATANNATVAGSASATDSPASTGHVHKHAVHGCGHGGKSGCGKCCAARKKNSP